MYCVCSHLNPTAMPIGDPWPNGTLWTYIQGSDGSTTWTDSTTTQGYLTRGESTQVIPSMTITQPLNYEFAVHSYAPRDGEPPEEPTDDDMSDLKQQPFWVLILQCDDEGHVLRYQSPILVLSSSEKQAHVAGGRLIPVDWDDSEGEIRVLVRSF